LIRVQSLSRRFGDRAAVRGLSFRVKQGEVLGFLGPNGAGKTTTMRVLTGYLPATSGTVEVGGFDVVRRPMEVKRRIGYLPESPPVYPEMRVRSYLHFVATLREVPGNRRRESVERAVALCALGEVGDRLIGNLSKGFRQRVGLAAALVHEPDVLILDEPTVGLDPVQILEIRKLIRALGDSHTVVLSTHILAEVAAICDRVIIINEGRVVVSDSLEALSRRASALEVQLARGHGEAASRLEALPGVAAVEAGREAGRFRVRVERGVDPREEIAALAVGEGWGLLGMGGISDSLEQAFVDAISSSSTEEPA
jgi:ABC-2 type transport system ATP-binding protein